MKRFVLLSFVLIVYVLFLPVSTNAQYITFEFSGTVTVVFDGTSTQVLDNLFSPGDYFSGSFTYDLVASDAVPDPTVGGYTYNSPPTGISVTINNFTFSNDPNDVRVSVSVTNDQVNVEGEIRDQFGYFVNDAVVFPVPTGAFSSIRVDLDDTSATALSSDELPIDLNLSSWELASIGIYSEIGPTAFEHYFIGGNIESITVKPLIIEIDIKPCSCPNSINLGSKGVVPVAVLTTDEFDATTVDPDTVLFAGAPAVRWTIEDVGYNCGANDGDFDLLLFFETQDFDLVQGSTEAFLTGNTDDGSSIKGIDSVKIVPSNQ